MPLTFGSLFAGIGGMDLGLERAGMECRWQVEIDPYATKVLQKHWPDVRRWDDVRTFPPGDPEQWRCDLIAGGDPCQINSRVSAPHAKRRTQAKDTAIHFLRIVAAIRPKYVLRENPSSVLRDAPWPWWRFRDCLESIGYAVLPFRVRSCCFGADHERERLLLLAEFPDANCNRLEGIDWDWEPSRNFAGTACSGDLRPKSGKNNLSASRFCRGIDGVPNRMDRLKVLGNSVDPRISEWIGRCVIAHHQEAARL